MAPSYLGVPCTMALAYATCSNHQSRLEPPPAFGGFGDLGEGKSETMPETDLGGMAILEPRTRTEPNRGPSVQNYGIATLITASSPPTKSFGSLSGSSSDSEMKIGDATRCRKSDHDLLKETETAKSMCFGKLKELHDLQAQLGQCVVGGERAPGFAEHSASVRGA